jgi:S1-C subfamily serine protease
VVIIKMKILEFSQELAQLYERVGRSVVALSGGRRQSASAFYFGKGRLVSSLHALPGGDTLTATLPDGTTVAAEVVGRDPGTDIAVLQLAQDPELPVLETATETLVGALVLAIGRSPEDGLGAALGVLSCRSGPWRTWRGARVEAFLQPDVSLYEGFGGGPLVDAQGRLIGLNSGGLSRAGTVTLPVPTLERVVEATETRGSLGPAYLGVGLRTVELQERFRQEAAQGALVLSIEPESAADIGGLFIGDILLGLGAKGVESTEDLMEVLSESQAGENVSIRLLRGGQVEEVSLVLGQRPRRGCC